MTLRGRPARRIGPSMCRAGSVIITQHPVRSHRFVHDNNESVNHRTLMSILQRYGEFEE